MTLLASVENKMPSEATNSVPEAIAPAIAKVPAPPTLLLVQLCLIFSCDSCFLESLPQAVKNKK